MEGKVWIPPYDFAINPTVDHWALIICGAFAFLVLVFAVIYAWNKKDMLPIYLFIAAGISTSVEPFVDVLGLCWYPEVGSVPGYRCIGRTIPLYLVFVWMFYFTPAILLILNRCQKGMTATWFMTFYLATAVGAFVFEILPLHYHMWTYYGAQPFVININGFLNFGFPLFYAFVNVVCVSLTGVAIHKVLPYLPGWKKIAIIPLMPVFTLAAWSGPGFYISTTMNIFPFIGLGVTRLGTIVTALICILLIWLAARVAAEKPAI